MAGCYDDFDVADVVIMWGNNPAEMHLYRKLLEPCTPAYVERISGIPAAKIRMLADLFGRRDIRITSLWCMGMNQHTRGTAINRLVHSIHLLSGHWGPARRRAHHAHRPALRMRHGP